MKQSRLPHLLVVFLMVLAFAACRHNEVPSTGAIREVAFIPKPAELNYHGGTFSRREMGISAPEDLRSEADFLQGYIEGSTTARVYPTAYGDKNALIRLEIDPAIPDDEGYRLQIDPKQITLQGKTPAGVFYGIQTLRQMIPLNKGSKASALTLQCLEITDAPRLPYRGMHLDVCRHFFGPEVVKRYLDVMARYKMNRFHWHLTDDQGWRLPSDAYPKLNTISSWRNETLVGHYNDQPWKYDGVRSGGYYTKEQIREIVAYADKLHITVIPEVEMPGHSQAILAAYPEFGCTGDNVEVRKVWGISDDVLCPNEATFTFLETVLDEVIALFPGRYIHVGGDECPKVQWEQSAFCQDLMQREGLADEMALQSWFVQKIEAYLNAKDRTIIGWDEILEGGLAPNAVVMSWRGTEGGIAAAQQGHDVIMTPTSHVYLDYYQSLSEDEPLAIGGYLPLEDVYGFDPIPEGLSAEEQNHILGAQGNVWTEYIATPLHLDYMAWPRGIAIAEITWTQKDAQEFNDFARRLEHHMDVLRGDGIYVANHLYDLGYVTETKDGKAGVRITKTLPDIVVHLSTDNGATWEPFDGFFPIESSVTLQARAETAKGLRDKTLTVQIEKHLATGKPISLTAEPDEEYNNGGIQTLVNGVSGSDNRYGDQEWRGFYGKDLQATIDLGSAQQVSSVSTRVFHGPGQWIHAPKSMQVALSDDGQNFYEAGSGALHSPEAGPNLIGVTFTPEQARYVRITIPSAGKIPEGHEGAGHDAWLFVDEIEVR